MAPKKYSVIKDDIPPQRLRIALDEAGSHVFRQQHEGSHVQSRYDAMAWREKYTVHGRCKCARCERAWTAGDPSEPGSDC